MRKIILFAIIGLIGFMYLSCPKSDEEIISLVTGVEFKNICIKRSIRCKNYCRAIFVEIDEDDRQKINDMYSNKWMRLEVDNIFALSDDDEITNISGSYTKGNGEFDGLFPYIVRPENTNIIIVIIASGYY